MLMYNSQNILIVVPGRRRAEEPGTGPLMTDRVLKPLTRLFP